MSRPLAGFASDRGLGGSRKQTVTVVPLLSAATVVMFGLAPAATPAWAIAVLALAAGAITQAWVAPVFSMVLDLAGLELAGAASGLASTVKVGGFLGPPVFGFLIDFTASFRLTMVLVAGIVAAITGLFIIFFRTAGSPGAVARTEVLSHKPSSSG